MYETWHHLQLDINITIFPKLLRMHHEHNETTKACHCLMWHNETIKLCSVWYYASLLAMFKPGFEDFLLLLFDFFTGLPMTFLAMIMRWFIGFNDYIFTKPHCDAEKQGWWFLTREPRHTEVKKKICTNLGSHAWLRTWVLMSSQL